jgi:hypothetical protein
MVSGSTSHLRRGRRSWGEGHRDRNRSRIQRDRGCRHSRSTGIWQIGSGETEFIPQIVDLRAEGRCSRVELGVDGLGERIGETRELLVEETLDLLV